MKKKKKPLKYKKERVVFSDVLPYEVPLIFSNRYFYRFLVKHKIEIDASGNLLWDKEMSDEAFDVCKFILGIEESVAKSDGCQTLTKSVKIPFVYKITHKQNSFRELAIIHPLNQVQVIAFYEKYKTLILHYCSQSNYSIRRPDKVACYFFYKDRLHEKLIGKKGDSKEEYLNEYENLKSYFSYQECANIYKFYESYRYQRAEKKYHKLLRFDIQSCFDSIYTHSIAWATQGNKEQYKLALVNKTSKKDTFGDKFDELMQRMNHNETNGILIGPEFSRIFAEIILQHIDREVENFMISKGLIRNVDYECYRYVDDYFVFFNDDVTKDLIFEQFTLNLKEYKMTIGESKTKLFEKPFVTDISIAKHKVDQLIADKIKIIINKIDHEPDILEDTDVETTKDDSTKSKFSVDVLCEYLNEEIEMYLNPNDFNVKYKTLIKETGVEYKNILNYSLSRISTRIERVLLHFDKRFKYISFFSQNSVGISEEEREKCLKLKKRYEKLVTTFIVNLVDAVFFLYSNNKRINTTLKVISILNIIIIYFNNNYKTKTDGNFIRFQRSNIDIVFKKIQDEINLVLQTSVFSDHSQLEAFYLLLPLKELGADYNISQEGINKYLTIKDKSANECNWNMLLISILLHYYGDQEQYKDGKRFLEDVICSKIEKVDKLSKKMDTETIILTMDIIACPYLDVQFKNKVLLLFQIKDKDKRNRLINYSVKNQWFTKWKKFDLNYELNAKVSHEVYS